MLAVLQQELRAQHSVPSLAHHPNKQVLILVRLRFLVSANLFKSGAAVHGRPVHYVMNVQVPLRVFVQLREFPQEDTVGTGRSLSFYFDSKRLCARTEQSDVGVSDRSIFMRVQRKLTFLDVVASKTVVSPEKTDVVPRRQGNSFVEVRDYAEVPFVPDDSYPILIPLGDLHRVVGRAIVHEENLIGFNGLMQSRFDCFRGVTPIVIARNYQGDR